MIVTVPPAQTGGWVANDSVDDYIDVPQWAVVGGRV